MHQVLDFESSIARIADQCALLLDEKKTPVVLIDGHAGAGKSLFAQRLQNQIFQVAKQLPRVIPMDDLYPGWEGLAMGNSYLVEKILRPLTRGSAHWQAWDWNLNQRGGNLEFGGHRSFDGGTVLIVEGCGSITSETLECADFAIFIDRDQNRRIEAIRNRDEGRFDAHWENWFAQEAEFFSRHNPKSIASHVVQN